jgi:hypothetical protein
MHAKPVGRGYVILEAGADHPWRAADKSLAGAELHAHEFHYSSLSGLPAETRYAYAVRRGHGIDGHRDGILLHRLLASYTHLRATSRLRLAGEVRAATSANRNHPDSKEIQVMFTDPKRRRADRQSRRRTAGPSRHAARCRQTRRKATANWSTAWASTTNARTTW